jgi:hypothetical protein
MSFGIPIRNGLSLGLRPVATLATDLSSFDPGPPWIVLTSSGIAYLVYQVVQDSSGTAYTVSFLVKSSNGVDYYIAPYEPSLYLDYTIPSSGVPGVQPGCYLVDDVSGNLTQTTFSSLITFSRASNATRFSPTGQLEYAPHNLLLQSEAFATSPWGASAASITANTNTAPNGTTTADTLTGDGTSNTHWVGQALVFVSGVTYTVSVFAKAGTNNFISLRNFNAIGGQYANFDLSTGVVGSVGTTTGSNPTSTITSFGSGWYRCAMTFTTTAAATTTTAVYLIDSSSAVPTNVNTLSTTVLLWGAQLAVGPNALDYTPTTTAVVYGPRFDYNPSTLVAQGLLIEEQRTNLWVQSEDFSNASWIKVRSSITADAAVSPSGKTTADKFIADTNNNFHFARQDVAVTSGTTYTQTIFAKAAEYSQIQLAFDADSSAFAGGSAIFTLTGSGSLSASGTLSSSSITLVGNGWYRCQISAPATATATGIFRIYAANGGAALFAGDGTSGIFIWGAQLEAGAFATSYIPTTTAATTRSADIASIGTLSPWYNASAGTIYAEFQTPITGNAFQASFNDATANNRVGILSSSSQFVAARNTGGAGVLFTPGTANAPSLVNVNKSALAFANTDYALCGNGGTVATASTYNVPTVTRLELGQQLTATVLNGYLRRITYTPRRLTDAELQSLTS